MALGGGGGGGGGSGLSYNRPALPDFSYGSATTAPYHHNTEELAAN